uniref:CpXC domain-containing protein n=2 Tax=Thermorudis TaxID=1649508 RepID=A0A7C2WRR3_9BACT
MTEQATSETAPEITTEFTEIEMRCVPCNASWSAPVARRVNVATHPDARLGILLKTMHRTACPLCKTPKEIDTIFDYYDPERKLVVQVRPSWEIHAGGGEDWYWARYEDLVLKYANYDVRVDVVFGFDEMIEKYLGGQEAVEVAQREWRARREQAGSGQPPEGPGTDDVRSA